MLREGFVAQRPLVYTDTERKHWHPRPRLPIDRPRWPELEDDDRWSYDRAFTGSPLAREVASA